MKLDFKTFFEAGTPISATGLNSSGRLGQSQITPEGPAKQLPEPAKGKLPPSAFNASSGTQTINQPSPFAPSSKLKTANLAPSPTWPADKNPTAPASSISPRGFLSK